MEVEEYSSIHDFIDDTDLLQAVNSDEEENEQDTPQDSDATEWQEGCNESEDPDWSEGSQKKEPKKAKKALQKTTAKATV